MLCVREIQATLRESVKSAIEDAINTLGVAHLFSILDNEIRTKSGGLIMFRGMQSHTADGIKSLNNISLVWVEEAQTLSKRSLDLLTPTIRGEESQLWFSWNPEYETDPVDVFFKNGLANNPENFTLIHVNYYDNPFFPKALEIERKICLKSRPMDYPHIWEGKYKRNSEAVIFNNRILFEQDFIPPSEVRFYYGVDWGFSKDPTALLRCFINDDCLYIDYEAGGVGIEMDELPALFERVPDAKKWPVLADNSRPETISYLKNRHGFNISPASKWSGSIEDGIERIKSFHKIYIHKRCTEVSQEFRLYSYKVDKRSGEVLPLIEDKNNHYIDALRYALDSVIKNKRQLPDFSNYRGKNAYRRQTKNSFY